MSMEAERSAGLLERERELATLRAAIEAAGEGSGGAIVVEGPPGIGKTSLLASARAQGAARAMRVVSARGAELERGFPYGVVRQFFESFVFGVAPEERQEWLRSTTDMARRMFAGEAGETPSPGDEFALLHSLYWMCVTIADERPLMMVLDDAQWADERSLRFVEFALRRLERLPFLFVVATRVPDDSSPPSLVALVTEPSATLLRPPPLSVQAVDQLVRDRIDPSADREFAAACHQVTGGNPFLVNELVHEVLDERLPATAEAAGRVRDIGPRGVARVVLLRLGRLADDARALAAALSVLADGVSLSDAARLAGLDDRAAAEAATRLEQVEIVELREGLRFIHPIVRAAVYEDLSSVQRAQLHQRSARLLAELRAPAQEIAAHLLHTQPDEDPWVVEMLVGAARQAAAAGDFAGAQRLLERAMRERAPEAEQPLLLAELGSVEARTGAPDAVAHLRAAAERLEDPRRAATVSIELANVLKFSLEVDEAAAVLLGALRRLRPARDDTVGRRLHAELLGTRFISPLVQEQVRAELAALSVPAGKPRDLLDAFLLAAAAFDAVATLQPRTAAVEFGRRALSGASVPADPALGGQALIVACVALIWAEDFAFVYETFTRALADAQAARSPVAVGNNSTMRSMCGYRMGRLLEAEADAATVLELAREVQGLETLLAPAIAYAVLCGIERGTELETLRALAFASELEHGRDLFPYTQLSWARGELCLAQERWSEALAHFEDCDRPDPGYGAANPAMVPWREGAALAQLRLGDRTAARELSAAAVARARQFGGPRAQGVALRAAALVEQGSERIDRLDEAVATLEGADAALELARAQCDLGATLRAAGQRTDAQTVLQLAHDRAHAVGAERIALRAAAELTAAGVRPRREPRAGLASLTPSERRVAEMAAGGRTNREIAQVLFVTEKTVETHLGHVYDKLGVRSRRKLPHALTA